MRQSPDDLVVHAGHNVTVLVHVQIGQKAEQHEETDAPEQHPVFQAVAFYFAESNACHVVLDSVIANAEVQVEVSAHLLGWQLAQTFGNCTVRVVHVAKEDGFVA